MALTVEDGTGVAGADSYLSVAAADSYHTARDSQDWLGAGTQEKEIALRVATQYLDAMYGEEWVGVRTNGPDVQGLDWPRTGAWDRDDFNHDATVPAAVQSATAELALRHVQGTTLLPDFAAASSGIELERTKVGPIETEKRWVVKTVAPTFPLVEALLARLTGGSNRLERA